MIDFEKEILRPEHAHLPDYGPIKNIPNYKEPEVSKDKKSFWRRSSVKKSSD